MTAKQESWWGTICDNLIRERNDGQSDHEEARISGNLFDQFEQTARIEEAITTATTNGMVTGRETERAEQGHFGEEQSRTNPFPERDEREQAIQDTITYLSNLPEHKPSSLNLTEALAQQCLDWCCTLRLLMS